jgi:hypothetical protein
METQQNVLIGYAAWSSHHGALQPRIEFRAEFINTEMYEKKSLQSEC